MIIKAMAMIRQVADIMEAVVAHDKVEPKIMSQIAAAAIIADKSDVHRSRVQEKNLERNWMKSDWTKGMKKQCLF